MGLTPDQAARHIKETPHGRVAFYDAAKGEIVKPDGWRPPDFRSLIKDAQTEQGKSEVSCVLEEVTGVIMAKPMIIHRRHSADPLHLLEMSAGTTPTMSTTSQLPQQPRPDGPTTMTWHQLEHEQGALGRAHADNNMSRMLRGVVSNMHLLTKLSREAGFAPYMGHAHYIHACYLKSQDQF